MKTKRAALENQQVKSVAASAHLQIQDLKAAAATAFAIQGLERAASKAESTVEQRSHRLMNQLSKKMKISPSSSTALNSKYCKWRGTAQCS